eukprot:UN4773
MASVSMTRHCGSNLDCAHHCALWGLRLGVPHRQRNMPPWMHSRTTTTLSRRRQDVDARRHLLGSLPMSLSQCLAFQGAGGNPRLTCHASTLKMPLGIRCWRIWKHCRPSAHTASACSVQAEATRLRGVTSPRVGIDPPRNARQPLLLDVCDCPDHGGDGFKLDPALSTAIPVGTARQRRERLPLLSRRSCRMS